MIPTISVILPTYNRGHIVAKAINSVLNQSYSDFELIIIDDASDDNTEKLIKSIRDTRIRYIKLQFNKGPAGARNEGIAKSLGNYIAFIDSDDEWLPQKLEKQFQKIKNSSEKTGVVYTKSLIKIDNSLKPHLPYWWLRKTEGKIFEEMLLGNFIDTPAAIVKKEVLQNIGIFDETFVCIEDYDLFLRIARKYEYILIDEPLLITNVSPNGVNSKSLNIHADMLKKIVEKNFPDYEKRPKALATQYFNIGDYYLLSGNYSEGKKYIKWSLYVKFNFFCFVLLLTAFSTKVNIIFYSVLRKIIRKVNVVIKGKLY